MSEQDRPVDVNPRQEFGRDVAAALAERAEIIVNDTIAAFPRERPELDVDTCTRICNLIVDTLARAIRDARADHRSDEVRLLFRFWREETISFERLFELFHLTERTALDELALDERFGVTSEAWPRLAQLVRRTSFQVLAALTERLSLEPRETSLTDRLTTVLTRPVFDLVLDRDVKRAERYTHPLALILFDIDGLALINDTYGYGVGDRVLERFGILLRKFFREIDYVARFGEGRFAVLLVETGPAEAIPLAERVRAAVEARLTFRDHRTDRRIRVTVSGGVSGFDSSADGADGERVLFEAEAALQSAKEQGRNRIERGDTAPREQVTLSEAARVLGQPPATVRRLVAEGRLAAVRIGSYYWIDRTVLRDWMAEHGAPRAGSPEDVE